MAGAPAPVSPAGSPPGSPSAERPAGRPRAAGAARPVFQLRGVSKTYGAGRVHALDPVDLVLTEGSFSSVIGPSGCGKTTLLKIMAGLVPPSAGGVVLDGEPVLGARREIGMMFQQATLFPWRTTLENVVLPIEIRDGRRAARAARGEARELLDLVGLAGFDDAYPSQLSGGMAQRAAICRMLITRPEVLLLDEPFSALDELARDFMNLELQRVCMARGATAFLITHAIPEAVFLSDTVYVMSPRPGRIVEAVPIDLPRPRTIEMMVEPAFGALVNRIRSLLDKGAFL